jgi:predicted membrane protein
MEVIVSIASSVAMLLLVRYARRLAKSGPEAALLGAGAGVITAIGVAACVVAILIVNPAAFNNPLIDLRVSMSVVIGPASGALMTVMLWRRAQSR